jgi:hypothetical protein
VKDLLEHNADVLACNSQGKWSLDMASPKSDVWSMLYKEVQWRSFLEQPRPCHIILVRSSCQNLPTGALLKNLVLVSCNSSLLGGSLHQIINIFCHVDVLQEGWEGPGQCSFSPILAILSLQSSAGGKAKPGEFSLHREYLSHSLHVLYSLVPSQLCRCQAMRPEY